MTFDEFLDKPDFLQDLRLNAKVVLATHENGLSDKQIAIVAVASAISTKHIDLAQLVIDKFSRMISAEELVAARNVAAIMGMNNIYYRFTHVISNSEYADMSPGLRMNVIARHGIKKDDFELASLAVSAINGCGACMESHEKTLRLHGVTSEKIQHAIKIAAVLHGISAMFCQ